MLLSDNSTEDHQQSLLANTFQIKDSFQREEFNGKLKDTFLFN